MGFHHDEYPFVYEHAGMKHMLYNGNGFGETGIGYAVLQEDSSAPCPHRTS
jgi:hypothetical protein